MVGIDDLRKSGTGSATFDVWVDGKLATLSGIVKSGEMPKLLTVDVTGAKQLILAVNDAGDGRRDDDVIWGGALLELSQGSQRPEVVSAAIGTPRDHLNPPAGAAAQSSADHRRHAWPSVPLSRACDWRSAVDLHCAQPAARPEARFRVRHHQRCDSRPNRASPQWTSPLRIVWERRMGRSSSSAARTRWRSPRLSAGTRGTSGAALWTMRRCAQRRTAWCAAASRDTATRSSISTTRGKGRARRTARSRPTRSFRT